MQAIRIHETGGAEKLRHAGVNVFKLIDFEGH